MAKNSVPSKIYSKEYYLTINDGGALTAQDNADVPTCVDCHEAHGTLDPLLPRFRLGSPEMCGRCHSNNH